MADPFVKGFNPPFAQAMAEIHVDARIRVCAMEIEWWLKEEIESFRRSVGQKFRRAHEANLVNLYNRCRRAGIKLP
jgi:hypothetical protein